MKVKKEQIIITGITVFLSLPLYYFIIYFATVLLHIDVSKIREGSEGIEPERWTSTRPSILFTFLWKFPLFLSLCLSLSPLGVSSSPSLSATMAGIRLPPEDSDLSQPQHARAAPAASDLVSDDDRSVAADSWSIKSEYGSTLDDDQRHADAAEALCAGNLRAASDYRLPSMAFSLPSFFFFLFFKLNV